MEWLTPIVGLISVLIGAVVGANLQSRNQTRAWHREFAVKIEETVYGPLYNDVITIISQLEKLPITFYEISFNRWQEFQRDHRHLSIDDETFRDRLDNFLSKVTLYNKEILRFRTQTIPVIVEEEFRKKFNVSCSDPILHYYLKSHGSNRFDINVRAFDCLTKNS